MIRILFWAALTFAVVMALLPHTATIPGAPTDKIQHMLAFGTLTILACAGYPGTELLRIGERLSFLGAVIEVAQTIPAVHRDCEIMDWVADTISIVGVLVTVALVRRMGSMKPA